MSQPYIGEIRMFGGNFAPVGWSFCNGQIQAISQNSTLFQLIGTTYGGDGQQTFALPDLQGRVPIHQGVDSNGNPYVIGQRSGTESVTLTAPQMPSHSHLPRAASIADSVSPSGKFWSADPSATVAPYNTAPTANSMSAAAIALAGGSQPHNNMQPFLAVSFIIALFGIFPSQN
jgi:microcystin-dependent protein